MSLNGQWACQLRGWLAWPHCLGVQKRRSPPVARLKTGFSKEGFRVSLSFFPCLIPSRGGIPGPCGNLKGSARADQVYF